jgi:hypothetical protein
MSTFRRGLALAATIICMVALAVAGSATPVHAGSVLVSCPQGHETSTYEPGLRLASQQVHINADGTIGSCIDVVGPRANGHISFQGNGQLSCVAGNASGTGTINWEPSGIPSTSFTWQGAVGARPLGNAVLVVTGTVTSNDFKGATLQAEFVLTTTLQQTLQCLTTGTETNSGVIAGFTIINL